VTVFVKTNSHTGPPAAGTRMTQWSAGAVTSAMLEFERQMAGRIDYRSALTSPLCLPAAPP
jgi:hypothetical protein